jgi:hypothetical protein
VLVSQHSTIRVKPVIYPVPARWLGQAMRAEVFEGALKL